jgi:hypothetical protein
MLQNYFLLPGTRYALAALEALSPIALNSAPVHALAVVTRIYEYTPYTTRRRRLSSITRASCRKVMGMPGQRWQAAR